MSRFAGPMLVAAFLAAGCGAAPHGTPSTQAQAGTPAASGPEIRPASVDQILAAVKEPGAKVVLVNVWATWCAPCREEFPELVALGRAYHDRGLRLVLVCADFDDQVPIARSFLAANGVDF